MSNLEGNGNLKVDFLEGTAIDTGELKNELLEIRDKYGDERRTNIDMTAIEYIEDESLIPEENIIINLNLFFILSETKY